MHKKTTLKDIGDTLDKLILDEKAEYAAYDQLDDKQIELKHGVKDITSEELHWSNKILKDSDPIFPSNPI